ncbi:MAG: hypothetical protein ACLSHC_13420 [Bilophila wadsworthia]
MDRSDDCSHGRGGRPDTPAAVVYRATWPDERILRGTVSDIARKVEEAGFDGRRSFSWAGRWLPKAAHHGFMALTFHMVTETTANEAFDGRCALYALPTRGCPRQGNRRRTRLPAVIHSTRPTGAPDVVHTPGGNL